MATAPAFQAEWCAWPFGSPEYYPPPPYSEISPFDPNHVVSGVPAIPTAPDEDDADGGGGSVYRLATCVSTDVLDIMKHNDELAKRGRFEAGLKEFRVFGRDDRSIMKLNGDCKGAKFMTRNSENAVLEYLLIPDLTLEEAQAMYEKYTTGRMELFNSVGRVENVTPMYAYKYCLKSTVEERATFTRTEPYRPGETFDEEVAPGLSTLCDISSDEGSGICVRIPGSSEKLRCSDSCQIGRKVDVRICRKCCGTGFVVRYKMERVQRSKIKHEYTSLVNGLKSKKLKNAKGYEIFTESKANVQPLTEHNCLNQDVINASHHLTTSHKNRGKIIKQIHSVSLIPIFKAEVSNQPQPFWLIGKEKRPYIEKIRSCGIV